MEIAYRKAWKALNTMLEEGRSYSGYERNSAFLHLGHAAPRFADVSGATGLDLMEDGRSIAVCDWDYDGRQDFWITNRTAPRLRLQHNRSQTPNRFVAFRLKGMQCNRDAVGARVSLKIAGKSAAQLRTVRAGDGFLGQSSSWIHFGVGPEGAIEALSVRWPGGDTEVFTGAEPNAFFTLTQGAGEAARWQPPVDGKPLAGLPAGDPIPPPSEKARVVMVSRLPFPEADYLGLDGERKAVDVNGRPLLLNLWATWCLPCVAEMGEWTSREKALRALGIDVLALSVDEPEQPLSERLKIVQPFLDKRRFPFPVGLADAGFLAPLEAAGRAQFDKYEQLPVPSTILLDASGRIAVVYKGPVSVEQIVADMELLDASREERYQAAVHFPGRSIDGPWPAVPTQMIDKFMSFGMADAARRYLDRFMERAEEGSVGDLSEAYFLVGNELALQKEYAEALPAFQRAAQINPGQPRIRLQLATLLFRFQRYAEALPHLRVAVTAEPQVHNTRKMLSLALVQTGDFSNAVRHLTYLAKVDPGDANARLWLGHALVRDGNPLSGEQQLRAAFLLQPNLLLAINELAWLLATHPDAAIRDPREALQLATRAMQLSGGRQPQVLDTLAAAQAASGEYQSAVKTIAGAISLARSAGNAEMVRDMEARRALYRAGQPYRDE